MTIASVNVTSYTITSHCPSESCLQPIISQEKVTSWTLAHELYGSEFLTEMALTTAGYTGPGAYVLTNIQAGTVLDLDHGAWKDGTKIQGWYTPAPRCS